MCHSRGYDARHEQVVADCATCTGGYCPTLGTIAPTVCPIYTVATPGATSKLGCRCQVSVAYLMLVHGSALDGTNALAVSRRATAASTPSTSRPPSPSPATSATSETTSMESRSTHDLIL